MTAQNGDTLSETTELVEAYQALEVEASLAEIPASEARYQQCRLAFEATVTGGLSQREFAKLTGVSQTTIGRQARVWALVESVPTQERPPYWQAYSEVTGEKTAEPAEPAELTVEKVLKALIENTRKNVDNLVGFDASASVAVVVAQAVEEGHALLDLVARWGQGEEVSEETYDFLADLGKLNV